MALKEDSKTISGRPNIMVLGMHRSGSSLATEVLVGNGFIPAGRLIGATRFNAHGHFENRFLVQQSKRLLNHFGGTWDHPPVLPENWLEDPVVQKEAEKLRAYRSLHLGPHEPWVIKDPRFCLLLPFFESILGPVEFVVTLRNISSVTHSILRRNEEWLKLKKLPWRLLRSIYHSYLGGYEPVRPLEQAEAEELWWTYYKSLTRFIGGRPVHVIHYEELLSTPKPTVEKLLTNLGITDEPRWDMVDRALRSTKAESPDSASQTIAQELL